MHPRPRPVPWLSWLALIALTAGRASAGYSIIDLGATAQDSASIGNAINAAGSTAGTSASGDGTSRAVQATGGGGFQGVSLAAIGYAGPSAATGINDGGQVVGSFYDTADKSTHAFRTIDGRASDLGTVDVGTTKGLDTLAGGINSAGEVAGTAHLADGRSVAIRGDAAGNLSVIAPIGDGEASRAVAINAGGRVAGSYELTNGVDRAFVADRGRGMVDLLAGYRATGFGLNSYGTAINAANSVAGYADFGLGHSHAFLAQAGGALVDIGVLNGFSSSYGLGINATSQVVGRLDNGGTGGSAFVYDPSAGLISLRSLLSSSDQQVWTGLTAASAINDGLQITGQGVVGGRLHGFLMTPIPGESVFNPADLGVPEPPALLLSALGCAIAAAWARLRRGRTAGPAAAGPPAASPGR